MTTDEMYLPVNTSIFNDLLPNETLDDVVRPLEDLLGLEGSFSIRDQNGIVQYGDITMPHGLATAPILVNDEILGTVEAYQDDQRSTAIDERDHTIEFAEFVFSVHQYQSLFSS